MRVVCECQRWIYVGRVDESDKCSETHFQDGPDKISKDPVLAAGDELPVFEFACVWLRWGGRLRNWEGNIERTPCLQWYGLRLLLRVMRYTLSSIHSSHAMSGT